MAKHFDIVPFWVRIVVGLLALANIAFGVSGYFDNSVLFQNSQAGVDLAGLGAQYASYEFAARNLAIGLALLVVAGKGVPESMAIMTITRALVEIQTIAIALLTTGFATGTVVAAVLLGIEILVVVALFKAIAKRDGD